MVNDSSPWAKWERNFVTQLVRLRERRQMTQTDLARALKDTYGLKFHQQTVQRIESGERPVRLDEAFLIAQVLDVELETMVSASAPTDDGARWAVDRMRRRARDVVDDATELFGDFLDDFDSLVVELAEREVGAPKELDPVTAWALSWAIHGREVAARIFDLRQEAGLVGGHAEQDLELRSDARWAMDQVEAWMDLLSKKLPQVESGQLDQWLEERTSG